MPAGEVDTRFPRIKDGTIATFILRGLEKKVNAEKGTEGMAITLESTTPLEDTDGHPLAVGFKFRTRINGASGARTREALAKDLALFVKAVEGPASKTPLLEVWNNPAILDNKPVQVKIGIQKEQNGFPESNSVKSWIIPNA
jgi:hypothetical protein